MTGMSVLLIGEEAAGMRTLQSLEQCGARVQVRNERVDVILKTHSLFLIPELDAPRLGSFNLHPGVSPLVRVTELRVLGDLPQA